MHKLCARIDTNIPNSIFIQSFWFFLHFCAALTCDSFSYLFTTVNRVLQRGGYASLCMHLNNAPIKLFNLMFNRYFFNRLLSWMHDEMTHKRNESRNFIELRRWKLPCRLNCKMAGIVALHYKKRFTYERVVHRRAERCKYNFFVTNETERRRIEWNCYVFSIRLRFVMAIDFEECCS